MAPGLGGPGSRWVGAGWGLGQGRSGISGVWGQGGLGLGGLGLVESGVGVGAGSEGPGSEGMSMVRGRVSGVRRLGSEEIQSRVGVFCQGFGVRVGPWLEGQGV